MLSERHPDGCDSGEEISAGLQQVPQKDIHDWLSHARNENKLQQLHSRWGSFLLKCCVVC